jgi:hypothetical protein
MSTMLNKKWLALFLCSFLLGACAATGPADDGYDNSNEWVNTGHLLSDEKKTMYSSEQKQASSMALDEKSEFEQFKIWNVLRAKGEKSEEYREFLQWLNYQQFKAEK